MANGDLHNFCFVRRPGASAPKKPSKDDLAVGDARRRIDQAMAAKRDRDELKEVWE